MVVKSAKESADSQFLIELRIIGNIIECLVGFLTKPSNLVLF